MGFVLSMLSYMDPLNALGFVFMGGKLWQETVGFCLPACSRVQCGEQEPLYWRNVWPPYAGSKSKAQ
jgi:hypothetical protein